MYREILEYLAASNKLLLTHRRALGKRSMMGGLEWNNALAAAKDYGIDPAELEHKTMWDEADAELVELARKHYEENVTYLLSLEII